MAVKVVHVSDISGDEADEQSLGQLVIHEHPEYADLPVTLEVLPEEVESLQGASRFVTVEGIAPGARQGERMGGGPGDFKPRGGPGRGWGRAGGGRLGPGKGQLRHPRACRRAPPRPHHRGREGTGPEEPGPDQQAPARRRPARDRPQRPGHARPLRAVAAWGDRRVPVLVGTSGWQYRHWRGRLYPAKMGPARRLGDYAARGPTRAA